MNFTRLNTYPLKMALVGMVEITFDCPRCGEKQTTMIKGTDIIYGFSMICKSKKCYDGSGVLGYQAMMTPKWEANLMDNNA